MQAMALAEQLLLSLFVNTRGLNGKNIPLDLHLEHLNRICILEQTKQMMLLFDVEKY